MQIIPLAVGQSDGAIVFWEDNAEIGVAWPRTVQVIDEVKWGVGSINQEECLVLYLFSEHQAAEIYLPEVLPTTPSDSIEIWRVLCEWDPDMLKVRYGDTPMKSENEVTFLLPAVEGESLVEKLRTFRDMAVQQDVSSGNDGAVSVAMGHERDGAETEPSAAGQQAFGRPGPGLLARLDVYLTTASRFSD
jgi:hypothetical protein